MRWAFALVIWLAFWQVEAFSVDGCPNYIASPMGFPYKYDMPGMKVGSLVDPTLSTGATVFYFPKQGTATFDARGGSVSSVDTTLLAEGSYSGLVDAIVFAGGSTMGLAAADGVRQHIFDERKGNAFDMIPTVPAAVIYDYSARVPPANDPYAFPCRETGLSLMKALSAESFQLGRAGAGMGATVNKVGNNRYWGGQGASSQQFPWGRVFAAVVLNSVGNIIKGNGQSYEMSALRTALPPQNTTLSIVVTDVKLDRNQLKRLATMVHTSMAARIRPFHTYVDGDILFAVSLNQTRIEADQEFTLQSEAARLMDSAIVQSVKAANP